MKYLSFIVCFFRSIWIISLFPVILYSQQPELVLPIGHINQVLKIYFNRDGTKIATTGFKDHMIAVWDVKTGKLLTTFADGNAYWGFDKIYFSTDGKKLLSYARDETIPLVWDMEKKRLSDTAESEKYNNADSIFMDENSGPDLNKTFDIKGRVIEIRDDNTGKILNRIECKVEPEDAVLSNDGNKLAIVEGDRIRIFNSNSGRVIQEWNEHGHIPSYNILFSPSGKRIITYSSYLNVWDAATGAVLNSTFLGSNGNKFENTAQVMFGSRCDTFLAIQKGNWQIWDAVNDKEIITSKNPFNGTLNGALSNDGKFAVIIYRNSIACYAEMYDLNHLQKPKKFSMGSSPLKDLAFSPDNKKLFISYEKKENTEIRMVNSFTVIKTIPGVIGGGFSPDRSKIITTNGRERRQIEEENEEKKIESYIWNIADGSLFRRVPGIAGFSPVENKIVTSLGYIIDLSHQDPGERLDSMDNYDSRRLLLPLYFSTDGRKIIGIEPNDGTAGYPDGVYLWDVSTRKLIIPDTADKGFDFLSRTGKKILTAFVNGDDDMKIIDPERKDTVDLINSRDFVWSQYAQFSPEDDFVYTSNDQTVKKWETSTGRLMYTFFPVDSTAFLTRIPSGYYTCGPDAAKSLHYLKGFQVINFSQLDIRYNRPDKVLEHIHYPDTALISAYRNVYFKRIKKMGLDTSYFQNDYTVPEADFAEREKIGDIQKEKNLALHIRATDSIHILERFNIWVNGVPLYGLKGINILPVKIKNFDTTITIVLTPGENKIETSVTNINGIESFRSPLIIKFDPAILPKEITYFIGIGINNFAEPGHQLHFSIKDMRDLSAVLKRKGGDRFIILDTLFDENVTENKIRSLKKKLLQTTVNDKVIIAYSGHGLLSKDFDYYLSTYNVNFSMPEVNGLPYDEMENLLDSIPARKKMLLIDACFSGEVDKEELKRMEMLKKELGDTVKGGETIIDTANRRLGIKNSVELMQQLFANVGKSTGTVIIAASAGTQFARESGGLKNSIFTYCVLEALKQYPTMNASRLNQVVSQRVIELTHGLQRSTLRNEQKDIDWKIW